MLPYARLARRQTIASRAGFSSSVVHLHKNGESSATGLQSSKPVRETPRFAVSAKRFTSSSSKSTSIAASSGSTSHATSVFASNSSQSRSQSSHAALLQTSPLSGEAIDSRQSVLSPNDNVPNHTQGFRQGLFAFATPGGTRLPIPLPPEVQEQRSAALRRRLGVRKHQTSKSDDTSHLAFGDFTRATLDAINDDNTLYTPSAVKENLAILRACLSTGLIARAAKIFDEKRRSLSSEEREIVHNSAKDATSSKVANDSNEAMTAMKAFDVELYNAMLGVYVRKVWQEENSTQSQLWSNRAWSLFYSMNDRRSSRTVLLKESEIEILPWVDPLPDATTYAVMAKGIVRLMRSNKYPEALHDLKTLLITMRNNSIPVKDVISSPAFSQEHAELQNIATAQFSREGEPDARKVLQAMSSAAADLSDSAISAEMQNADRMLTHMEREAASEVRKQVNAAAGADKVEQKDALPELLPVRGRVKPSTLLKQQVNKDEEAMSFNLRVLRDSLSIVEEARKTSSDAYERQKWLEGDAEVAARKRFDQAFEQLRQLGLQNAARMGGNQLQIWMWDWYGKLEIALSTELEKMYATLQSRSSAHAQSLPEASIIQSILPFLRLVSPKKLALITVLEMVRLYGTGGVTNGMRTAQALVSVGQLVEAESHAAQIRDKDTQFASSKQLQEDLRKSGLSDYHARQRLRLLLKRQYEEKGQENEIVSWTHNIRARVGSFLVQNLMNIAKIPQKGVDRDGEEWDEEQPAFYSTYQYIQGRRLGVIKVVDAVSRKLISEALPKDLLQLRPLPMLVPPKPWVTHDSGGYYTMRLNALRMKEVPEQSSYIRLASKNNKLDIVLAGLDVLGSTAWKINEEVYHVMSKVWNSGKNTANMPPLELDEPEPEPPANYDTDLAARTSHRRQMQQHSARKYALHSQRCDTNYKLEVARAYIGERFYFPHNMDFRGRAYPIPPTLNHMGNDLCRGLLKFADAKPLGESGLRWLRIHMANLYGFDKASFAERESFAKDHIDSIRASARDPLGPEGGWWLKADDPWQCLAACFELSQALEHPEGPEKYECSLPIHQDGTCNGLQHYAALGGDLAGAKQVNLASADRPSDVYTGVASLVIDAVDKAAAAGDENAKLLQGKITRKVVKQTVMTTVYGVTYVGAKEQVMRQLAARGDLHAEELWHGASFLAKMILSCIGDLFQGAAAIQDWLTDSALLIAKSIPSERLALISTKDESGKRKSTMPPLKSLTQEQMTSVIWTTPLGLPVVQPYRKVVRKQVATAMQTVYLHDPNVTTQVSPSKQSSAFPPNFIHSLDATHMFLTALECSYHGLTFAAVHDSYWTHACDISKMNDVIRDTFIRLHSGNILQRLYQEFVSRYSENVVTLVEARKQLLKRYNKQKRLRPTGAKDAGVAADEEVHVAGHITTESNQDGAAAPPLDGESGKQQSYAEFEAGYINAEAIESGFVRVTDLLPQVPKKGKFDVQEIRNSLYFFS